MAAKTFYRCSFLIVSALIVQCYGATGTINTGTHYQEIEGFGAAGAWYENYLTSFTPAAQRELLYDLLFDELGLDIYRVRNTYDQGTDGTNYMNNTGTIVAEALQRNPNLKILISSWSPPTSLKSNGSLNGGTLAGGPSSYVYSQFADWWADSITAWHNTYGVHADYISIQNEPDYSTSWDSCRFDPTQNSTNAGYNQAFEAVYTEVASRVPSTISFMPKMLAPETTGFNGASGYTLSQYLSALSAATNSHVYGYCHHLYNINAGDNPILYETAMNSFKTSWSTKPRFQTEYEKATGSWPDAYNMALLLDYSLTVEEVSGYLYWDLFWNSGGLVTIPSYGSTTYTINSDFYGFKHFSAFIFPGWDRIYATEDSSNLRMSAYISPDNSKMTVVIINTSTSSSVSLDLSFTGFSIASGSIYRSSSSQNCANIGSYTGGTISLPARTVTTLSLTAGGELPGKATSPSPANGAPDVSINTDLSWTAGSGATSHDVYFGTDSTPDSGEFQVNQPGTTFDPGTLSYNTTYYWRIDEKNASGTTTGDVWSFTTAPAPPSKATSPNPSDGASDVSINANLSWTAGSGATSHDVYFGTDLTPDSGEFKVNQPGTTFDLPTLSYSTTYHWRIDEVNAGGTTTGEVWSFTTAAPSPPGQATNPSPSNGVSDVDINADLSWTAGSGATSHDVYFGTDSTPDSGEFKVTQPGTTFDPGTLSYSTTYYWRIDEDNAGGTTTGDVWSFTTAPAPPGQATSPSPADGAPDVSINANLSWTAGSGATSHDVYFGIDSTPDSGEFQVNQPGTTFDLPTLSYSTTYYWRIDEKNAGGTTTGDVWSFTTVPDTTPPTPAPTWSSPPAAISSTEITMTATDANDESGPVYYYFECTTDGDVNSTWQEETNYTATDLLPNTQYTFKVKARDSSPAQNETAFSGTASATTEAPPTDIEILGSWVEGTSHAEEAGYSRALILIAHAEDDTAITLNSVTYGGQPMTKVIQEVVGSSYRAYVVAFILDEEGIAAATSNTFNPSWSATPDNFGFSSVFLGNVDQTESVGDSDSNLNASSTPTTITTDPLSTVEGDMVFVAASCGNVSDYTINNGFTEAIEIDMSSSTGSSGHKFATGADETPSVTNSSLNRQVIIGFVLNAMSSVIPDDPPAEPNNLVATAGNDLVSLDWDDNNEPDLAGYNVLRSTSQGGGYEQINVSLVVDSDYTDNDVDNLMPYYYVVRAVDDANNQSGYSNEATATPDYQNCDDVKNGGFRYLSDIDGDCYVDSDDLAVIADYWLSTNCAGFSDCDNADFEPDGDVDLLDFSDFAIDWLKCNNPADEDCTPNWP